MQHSEKRYSAPEAIGGLGFNLDPKGSLFYLLRIASRKALAAFQQRLEKHHVTRGQYFILRELWQDDGLTQREIGDRVNMTGPALTVALDAMEKRRFVVRIRSSADRRRINVFLTYKGRELRPILLRYAAEMHELILLGRSQSDVDLARNFLRSIREKADTLRSYEVTA